MERSVPTATAAADLGGRPGDFCGAPEARPQQIEEVARQKPNLDLRPKYAILQEAMALPAAAALARLQTSLPQEVAASLKTADTLRPHPAPRPFSASPFATPADPTRIPSPLPGGLPRGTLVEIVGRRSSGRFALALSALASATQMGESAALVDLGDHLDPQGAAAEGVELARVLWVRPSFLKDALACAELLLGAGFSLVVLDLGLPGMKRRDYTKAPSASKSPHRRVDIQAAWIRLARRAKAHDAALLVLAPYRSSGTAAGVVLTARGARARWTSAGDTRARPVLAGLETRLVVEKERGTAPGLVRRLELRTPSLVEGLQGFEGLGLTPGVPLLDTPENEKKRFGHG
jgi:hypothetical protein